MLTALTTPPGDPAPYSTDEAQRFDAFQPERLQLPGGESRVEQRQAIEERRILLRPEATQDKPAATAQLEQTLRVRGIDIVRLGLDGDRFGLSWPWSTKNREAGRRVRGVIDRVGASEFASRPIGEVSGGEQQRLLIAQALVREPRLLILDEPLDSLDLPNQSSIAELIRRVSVDNGVTVLMVAHDVNPILPYLDQVVYLAGGGAVCGTPAEVITSQTLSALYQTPIEVLRTSDGRLVVVGGPDAPAHHADRHTGELRR